MSVEALMSLFLIIRRVVIDLLRGSVPGTKLMKADVFTAGKAVLGREINNIEYTKVFLHLSSL